MSYFRLSFAFMNCPLCLAFMDHPALLPEMTPLLKQFEDIKTKSLQVLHLWPWWCIFIGYDSHLMFNFDRVFGCFYRIFIVFCSVIGCLQRLHIEGMDKDARLTDPHSSYFKKPLDYALKVCVMLLLWLCLYVLHHDYMDVDSVWHTIHASNARILTMVANERAKMKTRPIKINRKWYIVWRRRFNSHCTISFLLCITII